MITVNYDGATYECAAISRTDNDIFMYDENWNVLEHISGIFGDEWNYISIENGYWTNPNAIPTQSEWLNFRLDQMQADLDYCLMLLDE